MRHHETSIVGPDLDGPYPIDNRSPFRKAWDETNSPETPDSCPDPYPPDVLAAIPWAKEAGLELVECGRDVPTFGRWMFRTPTHFYNGPLPSDFGGERWAAFECGVDPSIMHGYYPTRAAALKSPPPKPPGFEQPPAQPSVGENVMRAIHVASGWSGVELTQSLRDTLRPMALAVRREVLAEPFTDEDVKAADKAFMAFRGGGRTDWIRAALSAALASRAKRAEREDKQ